MNPNRIGMGAAGIALGIAGLFAAPARGDVLGLFQFGAPGQETTPPDETSAVFNPTSSNPLVTVTRISDPNGTVGLEASSAATTPANAPFLRIDPQGNSADPNAAIANNKYYQFSISANPGSDVDLSSLTFNVARGGGGTPRGFFVKSSVDNFVAGLAASGTPTALSANATNSIGNDINTARPNYTSVTVDLSGASFQNVQSASGGTVTFRVYTYAPAAGSSVDFDDIALNGTASAIAVPEPGTIALGGLGAVGLLARRGRRT